MMYNFDRFIRAVLESLSQSPSIGVLGITSEDGTCYTIIRQDNIKVTHSDMIWSGVPVYGQKSVLNIVGHGDMPEYAQWRYNKANKNLYIWNKSSIKNHVIMKLEDFMYKNKYPINKIISINCEGEEAYDDAHFVNTPS